MESKSSPSPSSSNSPIATIELEAEHVYVLLSSEYRISRNRRAEWFFSHLNSVVSLTEKVSLKEVSEELEILSIIPRNPPPNWSPKTCYLFRYRICSTTIVHFLARKYRLVYCLDISPSVASVDVQAGLVMFEGIYDALKSSMEGLVRPFFVPGSLILFQPKVYATVIAHTPFLASLTEQVLIQGVLLSPKTIKKVLSIVFERLTNIENKVAEVTASISESIENAQAKSDRIVGQIFDEEGSTSPESAIAMSPDFGFVDLLRQALIGLHLLPENSTAGLIIVTDGVISVPDGGYLETVLSQLRYNTVSCSFIQLSSPFHPHLCYGVLPYADLMRFISSASFGAFLTSIPEIKDDDSFEMNIYQDAFLAWSFQKAIEGFKINPVFPPSNKPGEWSVRNKCFFSVRDMPIVKKQQYETTLAVDYMKVLSCRLREGFTIKEVNISPDNTMAEIKLSLPWKFLIHIEYILTTTLAPQPKVNCSVSLEGPYDFLHDVTCLANKKPFQSYYRQLMVSRFWQSQKNLSESDKLLVHFNSFSTNPNFYNIPDSLRNGVPLFYISSNNSAPVLLSSDFDRSPQSSYSQFAQFWKPVCLLDTTIWQKWMHTHNIGIILEHDHPLPKNLHMPNSSGRYHIIQCRQSVMSLNTLLKDWSSFVLVENHSYIKLMLNDHDKPPFSFYIIRLTSKPPCVVLRLAFLVGTPGHLRHEAVTILREKISGLTFPQRLKEPHTKWRNLSPNPTSNDEAEPNLSKPPFSKQCVVHCCTLLHKPIEKILLRYERVPRNFFKALLPQNSYNGFHLQSPKAAGGQQSTFGFRPSTFHTPWGSGIKMGPEMFNTVARYLHHQRWIWCVQSTTTSSLSLTCAAQILSTLTKMRLQEGFRFANSAAGTVNMVMELLMTTNFEKSETEDTSSGDAPAALTPCILQYVVFPPVTSLDSQLDDEEEGEAESVDDQGELYLVTECWIEPQFGRVTKSGSQNSYMDGLDYASIPHKIFEIDRECISALVTFEHLSLMCNDANILSPTHIPLRETKGPRSIISNDNIKSIPFAFELNRILPKSQQAEILFSMFNQDLSLSFPVSASNDLSNFCDQANRILYETWSANVSKLHDREVFLADEEHQMILNMITKRQRTSDVYPIPIVGDSCGPSPSQPATNVPKWRCFIRGINPTHVILTLLPASYHDLKLLMLSDHHINNVYTPDGDINRSVCLLSDNVEEYRHEDELPLFSEKSDGGAIGEEDAETIATSTPIKQSKDGSKLISPEISSVTPRGCENLPSSGRKRSRVRSGGESGPSAKRPLKRKNSIDNSFRFRAGSMDNYWRAKNIQRSRTKSADDKNYAESPLTTSSTMYIDGKKPSFHDESSCPSSCSYKINESPNLLEARGFPENHQPKYGSITLPVYTYDCSLTQLMERQLIRRNSSGKNDLYFIKSHKLHEQEMTLRKGHAGLDDNETTEDTESHGKNKAASSPEPKSDEYEFIPISLQVLQEHCERLEMAFTKSYIHGLFESLQKEFYIHRNDIDIAMRMCTTFAVEMDLNEFIRTVCGHFKEAKQRLEQETKSAAGDEKKPILFSNAPCCHEMSSVHAFIRKRFQNILLGQFQWVTDYSDIFFFKLSAGQLEMDENLSERGERKSKVEVVNLKDNIASAPDSSKNTSDFDEVESLTVKAESACSELLRVPSKEDFSKSPEFGSSDPLFPQEFIVKEYGCELEPDLSGPVPLFLCLTCTYKYNEKAGVFSVRDIPTCAEDLLCEMEEEMETEDIDLNDLGLSMQFVFMTVPPEIDEIDKTMALQTNTRTYSVCSASSLPTPSDEAPPPMTEICTVISEPEKVNKKYPDLPSHQLVAVKRTVDDVKWLLKDEITSFRWESDPVTEDVLNLVSNHVQKSVGKQGCQLHVMPLTFVNNDYPRACEKFKERFRNLNLDGYCLNEKGSWFYLVCPPRQSKPAEKSSVDQGYKALKGHVTEEMMRESLQKQALERVDSEVEDAEIAQIAERNRSNTISKPIRKFSGQEIPVQNKTESLENIQSGDSTCFKPEVCSVNTDTITEAPGRLFLPTPSQMSEISSLVGSMTVNEDGYEGDGSESGQEEATAQSDNEKMLKLPPFWMIFKVNAENVVVYFHCRYNEDDLTTFELSNKLLVKILRIIMKLRRIVNQDLLLNQLHDTRQCSPLLEPENEDIDGNPWEGRDSSLNLPSATGHATSDDYDYDIFSQITESTVDFAPGTFSCDIVWETKFCLHSRFRTGRNSVLERGIQVFVTTLIAFEVANRKNMFVYRDTSGNVFYLRFNRLQETQNGASPNFSENMKSDLEGKPRIDYGDQDNRFNFLNVKDSSDQSNKPYSEDVVLLQVHGITEAGPEIKEQLVNSLRNKLDDSVLDILSVTLDRNPHCKLTPEDVHFIQKPYSQPDTIIIYEVNKYAVEYLPAFSYYLHQNILQFLHIPKYTDFKIENHFQDYSRLPDEGSELSDLNTQGLDDLTKIFLYNQSPGGTGSRGIALCIIKFTKDHEVMKIAESCRPSNQAYFKPFSLEDFVQTTTVEEILGDDVSNRKSITLELRMWHKGRINLDLLKTYFATGIKHAMWDLAMEFYFLTAPLAVGLATVEPISEPTTPMMVEQASSKYAQFRDGIVRSSAVSGHQSSMVGGGGIVERRNSAILPPLLPCERTDVDNVPNTTRARSMSMNMPFSSARKPGSTIDGRLLERAPSPLTLSQGHSALGMIPSKSNPKYFQDPTALGLTRFESGEIGELHPLYDGAMKEWCDFGSSLSVPSLRIAHIKLLCRHDADIVAQEVEKIIQSIGIQDCPRQFWRIPSLHGNSNKCFQAGSFSVNSLEKFESMNVYDAEFQAFNNSLKKLKDLEKLEDAEYPSDLLNLFKTSEDFNPALSGEECMIISRNLAYWKMCTSKEINTMDALLYQVNPDGPKNIYKFQPLMAGSQETNAFGGSPSSISLDKMSRVSSTTGLASISTEFDAINHPLLISRQRLLIASINNSQISFVFYNWSKETSDRLIEQTKCLALWINARSCLLSSILAQKSGLFCHQPIQQNTPLPSLCIDGNPFTAGGVDVETLIKNNAPPKEFSSGRLSSLKKAKSPKTLAPFLECLRNVSHSALVKHPEPNVSLLKAHGEQLIQNKLMEKTDSQNALYQYWLMIRNGYSSPEAIQSFKQAARTIHYCMTPIIFLPRWRSEVAATRDNIIGTIKKPRGPTESKKLHTLMKDNNMRSRHNSGASQSSRSGLDSTARSRSSIWGLWGNNSLSSTVSEIPHSITQPGAAPSAVMISQKLDEKWHQILCESFIQEYMQYLQTLGFIPIHSRNGGRNPRPPPNKKEEPERNRHVSGASLVSSGSSQSGNSSHGFGFGNFVRRTREESGEKFLHYLQKTLQGGILLFEVGLAEPFFFVKLHALEAPRIQKKENRKHTYQRTVAFLDECDKIKILMHLHSFTYDFHLRAIHSYLSGRQLIFKQGYHLTNFLDDFIKYYPKGPNFARNTVHIGCVTVQNVSTPAHILYNYILNRHEKLYKMKVIRMTLQNPEASNEVANEFILTQLSSKKVTYKDVDDESQCDDFDLTLLIAHDTPPFVKPYSVDPSVLRLKYYIILTSRRELYPKNPTIPEGPTHTQLCVVTTPEALVKPKNLQGNNGKVPIESSKPNSRRQSVSDLFSLNPQNETPPSLSVSSDKEKDSNPDLRSRKPSADKAANYEGIREEPVNYFGYFSCHEHSMQKIVNEQVKEIEKEILGIVDQASVDCRRDLLWTRLLIGGDDRHRKNQKEDLNSRETAGPLSYWEFSEMLELVRVRSISDMDKRLTSLLRQPIQFYQSLLKLLTIKHEQHHRYFVAPDKSTHQMAIFSPSVKHSVVMLDINLDKHTADLSVVFKEQDLNKPIELEGEILNLIESVVNSCCYCCWTNLV